MLFLQRSAKIGLGIWQGLLKTWAFAFFLLQVFHAEQLQNSSLSKNLSYFKKLNSLSLSLEKRISAFVTYNDLAQKLAERKAMHHKNRLSKYNQSHLSKLRSKPEKESTIADAPRTFRRWVSAKNFIEACFFCDAKNDG